MFSGTGLLGMTWSSFESNVNLAMRNFYFGDDLAITCLTAQDVRVCWKLDADNSSAELANVDDELRAWNANKT
jgi:hypothetical protein